MATGYFLFASDQPHKPRLQRRIASSVGGPAFGGLDVVPTLDLPGPYEVRHLASDLGDLL